MLKQSFEIEQQNYQNPFKIQKTTELMLIQREQERFQKFKRGSSLSKDISLSTGLQTEGSSMKHSRMSSNDDYYKHMSYQRREGTIRLVNKIANNTMVEYEKKRHITINSSIDYGNTALNKTIDAMSPYKARIKLRDRSTEPKQQQQEIIIRDLPPTIRYLTKNAFNNESISPKESVKEAITNIRNIFYSQMSIQAKQEETQKLKEYIIMEYEKLEDAKKTFEDDCDRFQKYLTEMDQLAEQAKDKTEQAVKNRQDLSTQIDDLETKIQQCDRKTGNLEDELKVYVTQKDFVETVQQCRRYKTQSKEISNVKAENPNVEFFLTEQHVSQQQAIVVDDTVDMSKNEFLDIIQSLEDANIFLLDNIQNEEQELEKFSKESDIRSQQIQSQIDNIKQNMGVFEQKINEKVMKKNALANILKEVDAQCGDNSGLKKGGSKGKAQEQESLTQQHQWNHLKNQINKLFCKVKNARESIDGERVHPCTQLGEIERKLDYFLEIRSHLVDGGGKQDQLKLMQEAEKSVDKERKQARHDKKKRADQDFMEEQKVKNEERQRKASNQQNLQKLRAYMGRSKKTDIIKEVGEEIKELTEEEKDYLRYIEGVAVQK